MRSRARTINDNGAIVGTATYTQSGSNTNIANGPHAVMLLPLQLRLLNGSTADFDGSIPTNVIASPENPQHDNDVAGAGGVSTLGVLPMGQGRPTFPNNAYTVQTLVAAQAPAQMSALQYQWKRFLSLMGQPIAGNMPAMPKKPRQASWRAVAR